MINVPEVKEKILNILREDGPSLPNRIAQKIEMESMWASAILSELVNERRLKISSLKIGSSPLYLIPGQEQKLENLSDNLTGIDKTAMLRLKEAKILNDETQDPAIRVALRGLKDFATPFRYQEKIFWKYSFTPTEEIKQILSRKNVPRQEEKPQQLQSGIPPRTEQTEIERERKQTELPKTEEKKMEPIFEKQTKKPKAPSTKFLDDVKQYLESNSTRILEEIAIDKKEIILKVETNSEIGKIEFLLVAKDKKKPNEAEIMMAYQKAINSKMPCMFISRGESTKKSQESLATYKNLLKIISI